MIRHLEPISDTTECGILVPDNHWAPADRNVRGPASPIAIHPAIINSANAAWGICVKTAVELPRDEIPYAVVP
jgi:hypothetical protein